MSGQPGPAEVAREHAGVTAVAADPADPSATLSSGLAALRAAGAQGFDPLRLHYIDTVYRRARLHTGAVRQLIDARLAQAIATLQAELAAAREKAGTDIDEARKHYPEAGAQLDNLLATGQFHALRIELEKLKSRQQASPLAKLLRQLEHVHHAASPSAAAPSPAPVRPELKILRESRTTWARLSVERQLSLAMQQAPRNAGPINSHMLMLRSLELMRDISPDYLGRFMCYADSLLRLGEGLRERNDKPEKPARRAGRGAKKSTR